MRITSQVAEEAGILCKICSVVVFVLNVAVRVSADVPDNFPELRCLLGRWHGFPIPFPCDCFLELCPGGCKEAAEWSGVVCTQVH